MVLAKKFGPWDDYASCLLRRTPNETTIGWNFGSYDYERLRLFVLSVLWRMHESTNRFFENVTLGGDSDRIRSTIYHGIHTNTSEFPVFLSYSQHSLAAGLLEPRRVRIGSGDFWLLYMPRFQAYVQINGTLDVALTPYMLAPSRDLLAFDKDFTEFGEIEEVIRITKQRLERKAPRHG